MDYVSGYVLGLEDMLNIFEYNLKCDIADDHIVVFEFLVLTLVADEGCNTETDKQ